MLGRLMFLLAFLGAVLTFHPALGDTPGRWSAEQANAWAKRQGWLLGCNFLPSTAVNSLEMFQADSFDAKTIDRELGWAESLGYNSVRIFLNSLLWQQNGKGFLERLDRFLAIADKHHIGAAFVLFDSCWDPNPTLGKQPDPIPRVHNSRWIQSPGSWTLKDAAKRYGWAGPLPLRYLFWQRWLSRPKPASPGSPKAALAILALSALLYLPTRFLHEANPIWRLTSLLWALEVIAFTLCFIYLAGGSSLAPPLLVSRCLLSRRRPLAFGARECSHPVPDAPQRRHHRRVAGRVRSSGGSAWQRHRNPHRRCRSRRCPATAPLPPGDPDAFPLPGRALCPSRPAPCALSLCGLCLVLPFQRRPHPAARPGRILPKASGPCLVARPRRRRHPRRLFLFPLGFGRCVEAQK